MRLHGLLLFFLSLVLSLTGWADSFQITGGYAQEYLKLVGSYSTNFDVFAPGFSLTGSGLATPNVCTEGSIYPDCVPDTTIDFTDLIYSGDHVIKGVVTVGEVSYPYVADPIGPVEVSLAFHYSLSIPNGPPSDFLSIVTPFTMTGVAGFMCPAPGCPDLSANLTGNGIATISLKLEGSKYKLTNAAYVFVPEPGSFALIGLALLGGVLRLRQQKNRRL